MLRDKRLTHSHAGGELVEGRSAHWILSFGLFVALFATFIGQAGYEFAFEQYCTWGERQIAGGTSRPRASAVLPALRSAQPRTAVTAIDLAR